MADVINRTTLELKRSVHTPAYSSKDWIINPTLPNVEKKYWKIVGDDVVEMDATEKSQVDSDLQTAKDTAIREIKLQQDVNAKLKQFAIDNLGANADNIS